MKSLFENASPALQDLIAKGREIQERCKADPEYAACIEREHQEKLARARADHEARELARLPEALQFCGVPPHAAKLLVNPAKTAALDFAERWLASTKVFLALLGAPGTGKTVAAAATLRQREPDWTADTGDTWRWRALRGSFMSAGYQAMQDAFGEAARRGIERMCRVPLLVIDELGDEYAAAPWLTNVGLVINHRYGAGLRTVLVGNVDFATLVARYGARVGDRIQELGTVVELGESDRVRKGAW